MGLKIVIDVDLEDLPALRFALRTAAKRIQGEEEGEAMDRLIWSLSPKRRPPQQEGIGMCGMPLREREW